MPVVIAYQSLNSNSSSTHDISATQSQGFTRATQNRLGQNPQPTMLHLPTSPGASPDLPVHGPAYLMPTAPSDFMDKGQHDKATFLTMVEGKARQIHQNLVRSFPSTPCNLLVFGELDSSHPDWSSMSDNAGPLVHSSTPNKACNCFSVHSTGAFSSKIAEGAGWLAIACGNVVAVFVHVPNAIAKSESAVITFYQDINTQVLSKGHGAIDIIMGDTNQSANDFTQRVVSKALGAPFVDVHSSKVIKPFDTYQASYGGTNSTATQKYDLAVYNAGTIQKAEAIYISQFSSINNRAAAVTDHMGICVYLEK